MPTADLSGLVVRDAHAGDLPAITAIYAHAVRYGRGTFELEPPDEQEMGVRQAELLAGGYPYLVAESGGRPLGYAYASRYRPRPAYAGTVECSVYVHEEAQGRGVGRALLQALILEAEARGYRQMVAIIGDSANVASVALHRALGFHLVGTLRSVGWKHGVWLDTVLMQRALGAGDTAPR